MDGASAFYARTVLPSPATPNHDPAEPREGAGESLARRGLRWGLFVVVWLASTLFLLGDIGFWNDDYFLAHEGVLARDTAREAGAGTTIVRTLASTTPYAAPHEATGLWRPLLTTGVTTMLSQWWEHAWAVHVVIACCHACTALVLGALLRALGSRANTAWALSCVYVCWPAHFEVALWANGFLTGVSCAGAIACMLAFVAWVQLDKANRGSARRGSAQWRGRATILLGMGLGALLIIASNEQPAGLLLGLPLLGMAARPTAGATITLGVSRLRAIIATGLALGRAWLAPVLVAGLVLALGVLVVVRTQPTTGGTGQSFAPMHTWPARCIDLLDKTWRDSGLRTLETGAFELGLTTLGELPGRSVLLSASLLALGVPWIVLGMRGQTRSASPAPPHSPPTPRSQNLPPARRVWVAGAGVAMGVGCVLPLMLTFAEVRPRMLAAFVIAVCVVASVIVDWARDRWAGRVVVCGLGVLLAGVLGFGAVSMIGVQRAYQVRWHADQSILASLRAKLPDLAEGAVLMPLRCDDWPIKTGAARLDAYFVGPYFWSFAPDAFSRLAFPHLAPPRAGVGSLHATWVHPEIPLVFASSPTHGLRHGPLAHPAGADDFPVPPDAGATLASAGWQQDQLPPHATWVAWDRVVAFITRGDGSVDIVTEIAIRQGAHLAPDGSMVGGEIVLEIPLLRTRTGQEAGRYGALRWVVDLPPAPAQPRAKQLAKAVGS